MAARAGIQTFGKYQILERIATGAMAEIYKAKLEGIGGFQRTFAIKRILPNLSQNSDYIAMLVDEAKVAGLLSHANIVQILDLGQVDGIWYIAMEYVSGRDLGAVLRRARAKGLCLPVPHTVFVAIELLKGLEYAHQRQVMRGGRPVALNIIHRDVSPPNVLLSFQGEVKLTDFGIARASLKVMETVSGLVRGRFDFMSPEQASGSKDLDQRSDLFSVGVVLYEMLTGHHPFRAENELQTVERVRTGTYKPVSERNPEVPFALETIVDRALRVDREERYPSATALKEALDKFFHDAGFIFTHATLASYVKGLFPEANGRPGAAGAAPRELSPEGFPTDPGAESEELLEPEDPTGRLSRSALPDLDAVYGAGRKAAPSRPAVLGPGAPATPTSSGASGTGRPPGGPARPSAQGAPPPPHPNIISLDDGPTGGIRPVPNFGTDFADEDDDAETVIRRSPPSWDDPSSTAVAAQPPISIAADAEQETVIRRSPLQDDLELDEPPPVESDPAPRTASGTGPGSGTSSGSGRTSTGRTAGGRRRSAGIGWLGWILSTATLFVGLVMGAAAAVLVGWLAGFRPTSDAVGDDRDAVLRVEAAPGTSVRVDGDAVGSEVTLTPGATHEVEVHVRDQEPWAFEVVLEAGERRLIVVEAR